MDRPGVRVADDVKRARRLRHTEHHVHVHGDQHAEVARGDGQLRQRRFRVLHHQYVLGLSQIPTLLARTRLTLSFCNNSAHGRVEPVPGRSFGNERDGVRQSRGRGVGAWGRVPGDDEEQRFEDRQRPRFRRYVLRVSQIQALFDAPLWVHH